VAIGEAFSAAVGVTLSVTKLNLTKYGRESWAVAQRILRELIRRQRSLIFWLIFPVSLLVLNSLILAERANLSQAVAFGKAAPSTLVGAALFFSCLGGSVATVVSEREQQTLKRLFMSPLSGLSYFMGICLAHTVIGFAQTIVVLSIALGMGATFSGSPWAAALIIVLSIAAYVGVGFILGTQFARRTEDVNALVATFGVPLLILGGAFFPSQLFSKQLRDLAAYNPVYHMIEALVGVLADGKSLDQVQSHVSWLAWFAGAVVLAGWLAYQRMIAIERRL
jgi:ABC-2 type transport system permease protein